MKWPSILGGLAAVLLPMPLMLLLGQVMYPRVHEAGAPRVSPILDLEQRTSRVTYRRDCSRSSECEPPLGCLSDASRRAHYCIDSQCETREQCADDQDCRALPTVGGGPLVRRCVPVGVRREGERCIDLPDDKGAACEPGLSCVGTEGFCARACRLDDPATCPEGFFCANVEPEPACLPSCTTRGCPEGQECVRYGEGASVCARVRGPRCQQEPCPDGRKCDLTDEPRLPGHVWFECVERCGDGFPPCPEGRTCDGWSCEPSCSPDAPDVCAEGYRCHQRRPDRPWVCQPDV
ncbi:hypothetical protein P2318_34555 [Myxococcaceae bacterium GXIMD 01537]